MIAKLTLSLVVILLLLTTSTCNNKPKVPEKLHIGIATWPGFAPGFIAREKGFFGSLPVEISILDDFSARQSAFTSGTTNTTISTLDSFAFESGQGVKGKVIMILDESYGADGIVVGPRIKAPADLKGKKIAYTRGSPSHFFLILYLKKNGLSMNDISRVEVDDPGRAGEAFVSGSVDAAVTWEPNITQIVNSGRGRLLESTKTTPGLIVDVMVVNSEIAEQRKHDIQTFVNGWLKAVEYIRTNEADAYSIMAKNLKIAEQEFPGMATGLRYADINRNRELLFPPGGSKAIDIFNNATAIWIEEKLISLPQDGIKLIDPQFVSNYQ